MSSVGAHEEPHGTPHDSLVRGVFEAPEQALVLIRLALAKEPELLAAIDPGSVKAVQGSFIDEALRGTVTDLLFEVRLEGRPTLLYFLIEHQSTVRRWLLLRLGRAIHRIWASCRRQRRQVAGRRKAPFRLPGVLPVILYQGERWTSARRLRDLVDVPADPLARHVVRHLHDLEPILIELGGSQAEDVMRLAGPAAARFTLLVLRAAALDLDMVETWRLGAALVAAAQQDHPDLLWMVFVYVGKVSGAEVARQVEAEMIAKHDMRGFFSPQQLREQERRRILEQLLARSFGPLGPEVTERLERASGADLERWLDRYPSANALDEVFKA